MLRGQVHGLSWGSVIWLSGWEGSNLGSVWKAPSTARWDVSAGKAEPPVWLSSVESVVETPASRTSMETHLAPECLCS